MEGGKGAGERGEGRERDGIDEERGEGWHGRGRSMGMKSLQGMGANLFVHIDVFN